MIRREFCKKLPCADAANPVVFEITKVREV